MRLSKQDTEKWLPFFQAYVTKQKLEYKENAFYNWRDISNEGHWDFSGEYRIKPVPTYRVWTDREVPVGATVVLKSKNEKVQAMVYLITSVIGDTVYIGNGIDRTVVELLHSFEWKWPQETEWKACGVEVTNLIYGNCN